MQERTPPMTEPQASLSWPKATVAYVLLALSGSLSEYAAGTTPLSALNLTFTAALAVVYAAFLVLFEGVLWFWLGSRALGASTDVSQSIRLVGHSFLRPALVGSAFALLILVLAASGQPNLLQPYKGARTLVGLWALTAVVLAAKRVNRFAIWQVVVFVFWLLGLALAGLVLFRMLR